MLKDMTQIQQLLTEIALDFRNTLLAKSKASIAQSTALSVVSAIFEAAGFAAVSKIIHGLLASEAISPISFWFLSEWAWLEQHPLFALTLIAISCFSFRIASHFVAESLLIEAQTENTKSVRLGIVQLVTQLSKRSFDKMKSGQIHHSFLNSAQGLSTIIPNYRREFFLVTTLTGYIFALVYLSPTLTAGAILLGTLTLRISDWMNREIAEWQKNNHVSRTNMAAQFTEIVHFAPQVRLAATAAMETQRFQSLLERQGTVDRSLQLQFARLRGLQEFLAIASVLTIAIGYFYLKTYGWIEPTTSIFAFFLIQHRAATAANELFRLHRSLPGLRANLQDVERLIRADDLEFEEQNAPNTWHGRFHTLEVRKLSFAYGDHSPLFSGVDLTLERGQRYSIVGPSGSGKSTFVGMLVQLHRPTAGDIVVDGVPLQSIDIASWRKAVSLVSQELAFLNSTLRANLTYGSEREIADEELWSVLELVELGAWAKTRAEGLDAPIGANGSQMSYGQRQRLSIARALLRRPEILILDEATSNIDPSAEMRILKHIFTKWTDTTILVISHRDLRQLPFHAQLALPNGLITNFSTVQSAS
jgi:ABC-type multidrug transport system fused ATPase/permease subunit